MSQQTLLIKGVHTQTIQLIQIESAQTTIQSIQTKSAQTTNQIRPNQKPTHIKQSAQTISQFKTSSFKPHTPMNPNQVRNAKAKTPRQPITPTPITSTFNTETPKPKRLNTDYAQADYVHSLLPETPEPKRLVSRLRPKPITPTPTRLSPTRQLSTAKVNMFRRLPQSPKRRYRAAVYVRNVKADYANISTQSNSVLHTSVYTNFNRNPNTVLSVSVYNISTRLPIFQPFHG